MSYPSDKQLAALRRHLAELSDKQRQPADRALDNVLVAAATLIVVSLFLPWWPPFETSVSAAEEFDGAVIGWALFFVEPWPLLGLDPPLGIVAGLALLLLGLAVLATVVLAVTSTASDSRRLPRTTFVLSVTTGVLMTLLLLLLTTEGGSGPGVGMFAGLLGVAVATVAARIRSARGVGSGQ